MKKELSHLPPAERQAEYKSRWNEMSERQKNNLKKLYQAEHLRHSPIDDPMTGDSVSQKTVSKSQSPRKVNPFFVFRSKTKLSLIHLSSEDRAKEYKTRWAALSSKEKDAYR